MPSKGKYWGVTPPDTVDLEARNFGFALAGDQTFTIRYTPGFLDFYLNHVKLANTDFTANNGTSVTLNDPLVGGEYFDIIARKTTPISDLRVEAQGVVGGGTDRAFLEMDNTIHYNYSITAGKNAISAGPIAIASGATVTVPDGSTWTIV